VARDRDRWCGQLVEEARNGGLRRRAARSLAGAASPQAAERLLESQHEFLDFGGTRFGKASFSRDDAKAALFTEVLPLL
jgi:hypothetical protein